MLRFIVRRTECDMNAGGHLNESYQTLDLEVPELEDRLTCGGRGPMGFEVFDLVGVEVRKAVSENEQ